MPSKPKTDKTSDEELEIPSAEDAEKERVANYHRELQASKDSKPEKK